MHQILGTLNNLHMNQPLELAAIVYSIFIDPNK